MTHEQWEYFSVFRERFKDQCKRWSDTAAKTSGDRWLSRLQKAAADADENPSYPLETPIVYNQSLDVLSEADDIRIIVVGDNPGKDEQLSKNQRYLVGQAGKLGESFFRNHPELNTDFRKNVIILNKTPIHTAKTKQLAFMLKNGGSFFLELFAETQTWMARETALLQKTLGCSLWLVGYGELRNDGLFSAYSSELRELYRATTNPDVLVFQHFSMNRFSIDLNARIDPASSLESNLTRIGTGHRREILGW